MFLKEPLAALVPGSQVRKSGAVLLCAGRSGGITSCAAVYNGPSGLAPAPRAWEVRMRGEGKEGCLWGQSALHHPGQATHHQGTRRNNFAFLEYKEKLINLYPDVKSDLRQK